MVLSTKAVFPIIINFRGASASEMDLWEFVEKYAKAFSKDNALDEDSVLKILEILVELKTHGVFFKFTNSQHSSILSSVDKASQNKTIQSKFLALFKHHIIPELTSYQMTTKPDSKIIDNPARMKLIIRKLSAMILDSENLEGQLRWSLLFRASEHAYKAKSFHENCGAKGPTVTLVKANNRVAAAYNCNDWLDLLTISVSGEYSCN